MHLVTFYRVVAKVNMHIRQGLHLALKTTLAIRLRANVLLSLIIQVFLHLSYQNSVLYKLLHLFLKHIAHDRLCLDVNHLGIKLAGLSLKIWDLFLWLCSRGSRCC